MLLGKGPIQKIFQCDSKSCFSLGLIFMLIPQPCGSCTTQCKFESQTCAWLQILIGPVHPHPWGKFFFYYFSMLMGELLQLTSSSRMKPLGCQLYAVGTHFQLPVGHGPKSYFLSLCVHQCSTVTLRSHTFSPHPQQPRPVHNVFSSPAPAVSSLSCKFSFAFKRMLYFNQSLFVEGVVSGYLI